jgi:hypothetical protein
MAAGGARRLSGLQRQVLGLYRDVLRAARTKDVEARASIQQYARSEIDRRAALAPPPPREPHPAGTQLKGRCTSPHLTAPHRNAVT